MSACRSRGFHPATVTWFAGVTCTYCWEPWRRRETHSSPPGNGSEGQMFQILETEQQVFLMASWRVLESIPTCCTTAKSCHWNRHVVLSMPNFGKKTWTAPHTACGFVLTARVTYIIVLVRKLLGAGALVLQQVMMGTAAPEQHRTKHNQLARLVSKPLLGSGNTS